MNEPIGANYDVDAHWNQLPERRLWITCCQSLSKDTSILTDNYVVTEPDENRDYKYSIEDENIIAQEYHFNEHYTPLQLLELFKKFLTKRLEDNLPLNKFNLYRHLISECSDWVENDIAYVE